MTEKENDLQIHCPKPARSISANSFSHKRGPEHMFQASYIFQIQLVPVSAVPFTYSVKPLLMMLEASPLNSLT